LGNSKNKLAKPFKLRQNIGTINLERKFKMSYYNVFEIFCFAVFFLWFCWFMFELINAPDEQDLWKAPNEEESDLK